MKFLNKKIIALVTLLSITGYSFGYEYEVSNLTTTPLVVKLSVNRGNDVKYEMIEPSKVATFNFTGAGCLESIYVAPYDAMKGYEYKTYAIMSVDMVVEPASEFDTTVQGTQELVKGIGTAACEKLEKSMNKEECAKAFGNIAKKAGKIAAGSLCMDRKFILISTGQKAKRAIGGRTITLPYDEYIAISKAETVK